MAVPISENTCPICGGTGWKIVERGGLSGASPCQCREQSRSKNLREDAGIPPNYARATLENFVIPPDNSIGRRDLGQVLLKVKGFVHRFPAEDHPGLLLVGGPGSGKTHLAVGALKALIEKGHEGLFFD